MKRKFTHLIATGIVLLTLAGAPLSSQACSYFVSTFCEVVRIDTAAPVVRAVISQKNNANAHLKVLEVWRGSVASDIVLWGLPDWDCNGSIFNFSLDQLGAEGDTVWVVLLNYNSLWNDIPGATNADYVTRSETTQKWVLREVNGRITGLFDDLNNENSLNYNNFVDQLGSCSSYINSSPVLPSSPLIQSRPDEDAIRIVPVSEGEVSAWISDLSGRRVVWITQGTGENIEISTAGLPAGIYVLYVKQNAWEGVKKVRVR